MAYTRADLDSVTALLAKVRSASAAADEALEGFARLDIDTSRTAEATGHVDAGAKALSIAAVALTEEAERLGLLVAEEV